MISKSGQVTLPRAIAKVLGVSPGQRILYSVAEDGQTVTISREKTLEESLSSIDQIRHHAIHQNPAIADNIARDTQKTPAQIRSDWDHSAAGQSYYQEKYGL